MNNTLSVEKLVDDMNMLGKHGVAGATVILDPDDLSGAFFKFHGPRDPGAILTEILAVIETEFDEAEMSLNEKEEILELFKDQCIKHLTDKDIKVSNKQIRCSTTSELPNTELGQIVLKDIEEQVEELGYAGFFVLVMIHVSNKQKIYCLNGDAYTTLYEIAACFSHLLDALTVDDAMTQQFVMNIDALEQAKILDPLERCGE